MSEADNSTPAAGGFKPKKSVALSGVDARFQIRAVRSRRDDDVGPVRAAGGRDLRNRLLVAARDEPQIDALVVFAGDVAKQVAQAADADGPNAGARGGCGRAIHRKIRVVPKPPLSPPRFFFETGVSDMKPRDKTRAPGHEANQRVSAAAAAGTVPALPAPTITGDTPA